MECVMVNGRSDYFLSVPWGMNSMLANLPCQPYSSKI
jgi:hypothetical protein